MKYGSIAALILAGGALGACALDSAGTDTDAQAGGPGAGGSGGSSGSGGSGGSGGPPGTCGDGAVTGAEACDDGDAGPGDGCSDRCAVEPGFACAGAPSACAPICGDGLLVGAEACDDGGADPGDGCGVDCAIEPGYACSGAPSVCSLCGDGSVSGAEQCEDGDLEDGDGCSATCTLEAECGNDVTEPGETCDDANTDAGDGCDAFCEIEAATTCGDAVDLKVPAPNIAVVGGVTTYLGSTSSSTLAGYGAPSCAPGITPSVPTVLHRYTLGPWPARLGMSTSNIGGALDDTVIRAYLDCQDPSFPVEIACNDDITAGLNKYSSAWTRVLPAGTTVFIVVSGFALAHVGPYQLNIVENRVMLFETFDAGLGLFEVTDANGDGESWEWCESLCSGNVNTTQSPTLGGFAFIIDDQMVDLDHEVFRTPLLDAEGLTYVALSFNHDFDEKGGEADSGKVEVSTDLMTWSEVATYTPNDAGNEYFDISSAVAGAPSFAVRFVYDDDGADADHWKIDDVQVSGL